MTRLVFRNDTATLPPAEDGLIPVTIYGRRKPDEGSGCVGGPVIDAVRRLGVPANARAFDFLTIAMAVTAADTFVGRRSSADGWSRELQLEIPVVEPLPWTAVKLELEETLGFLTGDRWSLEFTDGGPCRPSPQTRGKLTTLLGHDCVSLFSGGLDSAIGVLDLVASGRRPVLVSHSYGQDSTKQRSILGRLPVKLAHFAAIAFPRADLLRDDQMRSRSFNFLAFGALVAATMADGGSEAPVELHVPENGLIALNPPLTRRRIGSLSTRTTHPHFMSMMRGLMKRLNLPVNISTAPYATMTKGEMMASCKDPRTLKDIASGTVSCGHWKRSGTQCGRCVPCLIRRAAFHGSGITDETDYQMEGRTLSNVMDDERLRDDLLAMLLAVRRFPDRDVKQWIRQAGPLPVEPTERAQLFDVASRGMREVSAFLASEGLLH